MDPAKPGTPILPYSHKTSSIVSKQIWQTACTVTVPQTNIIYDSFTSTFGNMCTVFKKQHKRIYFSIITQQKTWLQIDAECSGDATDGDTIRDSTYDLLVSCDITVLEMP